MFCTWSYRFTAGRGCGQSGVAGTVAASPDDYPARGRKPAERRNGLVLYRLTVVAALTGAFSSAAATGSFFLLVVGGIGVGILCGLLAGAVIGSLLDGELGITASFLFAWGSYILGEALGVSGVLATVACGIIMGWRQHERLDASDRLQTQAVAGVVGFILESLVFILIGLSLRSIVERIETGSAVYEHTLLLQSGAIVLAVIVSRFLWIVPMTYGVRALAPALRRRDPYPPLKIPLVMSWAGMRGVVSLAAALALPDAFPGRDFILVATFAVILVTVLVQGSTLAPLIRLLRFDGSMAVNSQTMSEGRARLQIVAAQLAAVEEIAARDDGTHLHPRLIEQLQFRLGAITRGVEAAGGLDNVRTEH